MLRYLRVHTWGEYVTYGVAKMIKMSLVLNLLNLHYLKRAVNLVIIIIIIIIDVVGISFSTDKHIIRSLKTNGHKGGPLDGCC